MRSPHYATKSKANRSSTPLPGKNNAKTKIGDALATKYYYNYHLRKHCNVVNVV